jgi:protein-tyrosine-phosphatase/predicted ATP-grasp superfamily ATP-dependent carboligase
MSRSEPSLRAATGRVLVLGDDTRSFLTVVRSLGRRGLEVHVAWCPLDPPALKSRHIHCVHRLPAYTPSNRRWLDALIGLLRSPGFDLVLPCHDSGLLPLHEFRHELEPLAPIALPSPEAFRIFFSKAETYELALRTGVAVPRQTVARSLEELEAAADDFGLPLVIKPQCSVAIDNPAARLTVRKLRDRAALRDAAAGLRLSDGVLAQENFTGVGVGVEVMCRDGEILSAFQHLRVHEPLNGGGSSYRKSVPLDPGLLEATGRLMSATAYTGVAMAEYKVNPRSGKWILIEVNPRFWGSLPLTVAAGLDFPAYLHDLMRGSSGPFPRAYRTGVYARNWISDLIWLKSNFEVAHNDPDLLTVPAGRIAGEIWNVLGLREHADTITLDDPLPGIAEIGAFVGGRLTERLDRAPWRRRRLQRRAEAALRSARRVLFLCHGNICRSPFAEYALRRTGSDVECASTGYHTVDGRPSPPAAVAAAAQAGIDLSPHRSRFWDAETMAWADAILIFERKQRLRLAATFPEALARTHFLGALDPAGPLEVADPYGHDERRFADTYRRILELLRSPAFDRAGV